MAEQSARELIDLIVDEGSFTPWSLSALGLTDITAQDPAYAQAIATSRQATSADESIVTGTARIDGREICVIFSEFGFLAGSVGRLACQILIRATALARQQRLPVLASSASGGTRMQEGTPSFVLMADVAAAVTTYRAAGLPWVTWLRHPTTGGVMATWGSLGTVTYAEPAALVGFLGPRVYASLVGKKFPDGVQVSENLVQHGIVDAIAQPADLRRHMAAIAALVGNVAVHEPGKDQPGEDQVGARPEIPSPGAALASTERADRLGSAAVLAAALTNHVRLSGTTAGERSSAITVDLGSWCGTPVVVVAQDRSSSDPLGPAALRFAQRGFAIAAELGLPLVTIVDTAGAELSPEAEQGALAGEIARSLSAMTALNTPTVSLLLGRGCGGGAIAMLAADRVIAVADTWVAPLPVAGAAVIRYRTPDRSDEMANELRIGVAQLRECGFVTGVVSADPDRVIADSTLAVSRCIAELSQRPLATRQADRQQRFSGGIRW